MDTSAFAGFDPSVVANLAAIVQNNPLLNDLYSQFLDLRKTGALPKIVVGAAGGGTHTEGPTITIDRSWLPGGSQPLSYPLLATVLAHELAHAVLPNGHAEGMSQAASPDKSTQIGETAEGQAYITGYVVGIQLGLKPQD